MGDVAIFQAVLQCLADMILTDQIVKGLRPPFAIKSQIGHAVSSLLNDTVTLLDLLKEFLLELPPKNGHKKSRAPAVENSLPDDIQAVSSNQAPSRHIRGPTYRCFLP